MTTVAPGGVVETAIIPLTTLFDGERYRFAANGPPVVSSIRIAAATPTVRRVIGLRNCRTRETAGWDCCSSSSSGCDHVAGAWAVSGSGCDGSAAGTGVGAGTGADAAAGAGDV